MKTITVGNGFIASCLPYPIVKERIRPEYDDIEDFLDFHRPECIVNCIGWCGGRNIDGCELDKQRTFTTNTILPIMLASACEKRNIKMVQIASGCVFYGHSPTDEGGDGTWEENDPTIPSSTYSRSKLASDLALETMPNVVSLRIRMPISSKNSPRNLLSKLLNYKRVVEAPNSITVVDKELSRVIEFCICKDLTGIYHFAQEKPITHSRILNEYRKYDPSHEFTSITPEELDGMVSAPRSNCILNVDKLKGEGFEFRDTDELLDECIREFAKNRGLIQ